MVERSDRIDFTLPPRRRASADRLDRVALSSATSTTTPSGSPRGPIDGGRLQYHGGRPSDFSNSRFDSFLLTGDWRKYFRLGRHSAWAWRAYGYYSGGDRPRRANIGGTLALRGYPQFGYIVGRRAFMFNQEVRFPVLTHLTLGTPLGDLRFSRDPGRTVHRRRPGDVLHLRHPRSPGQLRG